MEENVDVIEWVDDPAEFIYNAVAPAEVDQVLFDEEDDKHATVVVPDNKLSLAIGRRGQNVRLAAHLTGYRIDIKSASEFEEMEAEWAAQDETQEATYEEAPAEEVSELSLKNLQQKMQNRKSEVFDGKDKKIPLRKSLVSGDY